MSTTDDLVRTMIKLRPNLRLDQKEKEWIRTIEHDHKISVCAIVEMKDQFAQVDLVRSLKLPSADYIKLAHFIDNITKSLRLMLKHQHHKYLKA